MSKKDDHEGYFGQWNVRADERGRISIPAGLRISEGSKVYFAAKAKTSSLLLKPEAALPPIDKNALADIASRSCFVRIDDAHRINLPAAFECAALGIETKNNASLTLVGCGDYFEIWSKEAWEKESPERDARNEKILADIFRNEPK